MTSPVDPNLGPTNDDWMRANDNSGLERLADEISKRPVVTSDIGSIALKIADKGEQRRWDNFAAGKPIEAPSTLDATEKP